MKIMAMLDGEPVCIQVVKRGETVYIRRCAYTMFNPTPKQYAVRKNLALTSITSYDVAEAERENLTREDINYAVREAFAKWFKEPRKRPEIEELLEDEYGSQVKDTKETYRNLKTYNYP